MFIVHGLNHILYNTFCSLFLAFCEKCGLALLNIIPALMGALAAHISVNALNEYDDFKSGLDLKTVQTPFSGGSKSLPNNPGKAYWALISGIVSLLITILIVIYFAYKMGIGILPLGIFGVFIIVAYTRWITHRPLLCLIAPGLGFGTLMVIGTEFVLTGAYSFTGFVASLTPFFLVSNLLLLNQFPDADTDKEVGRNHFPIVVGKRASVWIYIGFFASTYFSIFFVAISGILPNPSLIALITILFAVPTIKGVLEHFEKISELIPFMGKNVIIIITTSLLLSIGIFLG